MYSCTNKIDTEIKGCVKGVESSSMYTIRAVMLYMSEVSKVHTGLSLQSYVTHVEGVESSSNIHYKSCNAMYVKGVERSSKWS